MPTFLVIGAMRSGTTSLARYLSDHPEVFVPTTKELHFFDRHWDRGLAWYGNHFAQATDERAIGEATPGYMYFPHALDRMAATCPEARLIAILRNPIDRAYSHYWLNRALGDEPLSFGDAVEREPERLAGGAGRPKFAYVDMGRYLQQLEIVCTYFQRSSLHVVLFEDLVSDPLTTYAGVCRFLGVDERFGPASLGARTNGYAKYRWRGVQKLARSLPPPLGRRLKRLTRRRASYPTMDPIVRALLQRAFADANEGLERWLGRDLSVWKHQ